MQVPLLHDPPLWQVTPEHGSEDDLEQEEYIIALNAPKTTIAAKAKLRIDFILNCFFVLNAAKLIKDVALQNAKSLNYSKLRRIYCFARLENV